MLGQACSGSSGRGSGNLGLGEVRGGYGEGPVGLEEILVNHQEREACEIVEVEVTGANIGGGGNLQDSPQAY